jgi:hypothetical protein
MSQQKPTIHLWALGEPELRDAWYKKISAGRVAGVNMLPLTQESATRNYQLHFRPGEPASFVGVVLIVWYKTPFSILQRALLLLASRYTSFIYVLLCGCQESSQSRKDQEEQALRMELSSAGFQGDEAFIFEDTGILPSAETVALLLEKLDAEEALLSPPRRPLAFPEKHKDKTRAEMLSTLRGLVRPAAYLRAVSSSSELLFQRGIGTQFGGMPYLEQGEDWPTCKFCRETRNEHQPLCFVWQIDITEVFERKGLYTFYSCGGPGHRQDNISMTIRYYERPEESKRQAPRAETNLTFYLTNQPIFARTTTGSSALELPAQWSSPEGKKSESLTKESPQQKKKRLNEYNALCQALCVAPARLPALDWSLKVGGSSPIETIICARCGGSLQSLAIVYLVGLPWNVQGFHFLFCACEPSIVYTRVEREKNLYLDR